MHNKSNLIHNFSLVPKVNYPRSVFNRSHTYKCTMDADWAIPFYCDEVLPGDTFNLKTTILIRLNSPSIKPFMDNLWVNTFFFFVPNRLLWSNFKKFMGEQDNPADSITTFNVPYCVGPNVAGGGIPIGHLFDYMGIPVGPLSGGGGATGIQFNNLHGRAYNQIFNTWLKDENLQNNVTVDVGDGPDTFGNYNLLKVGKMHDYFTSALPWPLKGGTEVALPLGVSATVKTASSSLFTGVQTGMGLRRADTGNYPGANTVGISGAVGKLFVTGTATAGPVADLYPENLYADLQTATAATLNSLRQAVTLQQFLERDARGGTRYPELVLSHFGVQNPDARVQRPELLGTFKERLNITPVAQTAPKGAAGTLTDQGNLSGFGTGAFHGHGFQKSFTEHGVLIGLIAVRADMTYEQGQDRMWSRRTRYDFYFPVFNGLGEQAIYNREIYANLPDGTASNQKDGVFGYIPRFDEYRFKTSKITGNMRSYLGNGANANTLNVWHLAEAFSAQPTLGATFIQSNAGVPLDRAISVPAQDQFILDAFFDLKCARVMPVYSVPGLSKL